MNNQDNSSNENNSVENNNTNTNNNSVENNNANTNNTTQNTDEVQKIISNQKIYLEVLKKEYDLELAKKQSLETRAGFIFAFIATISTFKTLFCPFAIINLFFYCYISCFIYA